MAVIDEMRNELGAANKAASELIDLALETEGAESKAALAKAKPIQERANSLSKAILEWNEARFRDGVATLEKMVADERRAQSDVVGRLENLLKAALAEAGLEAPTSDATNEALAKVLKEMVATRNFAPPFSQPLVAMAPAINPEKRDSDLSKLHPAVRGKVENVIADLEKAGIPMKVFEAFRAPERQRMLFGKGRLNGKVVDKRKVVTHADAWQSYHQYGLAVDMVIDNPPMGMWETEGIAAQWWDGYHEIARKHGLEPLSFEKPHVQLAGAKASALLAGEYPEGGDDSWADNLTAAIERWPEAGAPPLPSGGDRPPIAAVAANERETAGIDWAALPKVAESPFAGMFGGQAWRVDGDGVYLAGSPATPQRTPGAPITASRIVELFGRAIAESSARHGVAPELLIMTIATETGEFRDEGYTGPKTFRWEEHFTVRNTGDAAVDGKEKGDYSAGPMQVMADTARGVNAMEGLGYDNARDFQFFKNKPAKAPAKVGLYDPNTGIDVGACFIGRQLAKTSGNPILVAAAYNAGSLRASGTSLWGIHAHGDHLDRAARWFGDACAVLKVLGR